MSSIPTDLNVASLNCSTGFKGLDDKEKLYLYYLSKACWEGAKICLFQCSYESPAIFSLLQLTFSNVLDESKLNEMKLKSGVSDDSWNQFLAYSAAFYSNMGNFKSFGDSKFFPQCSKDDFVSILKSSFMYEKESSIMDGLLTDVLDLIYSVDPVKELGFPPSGTSGYYSSNVTNDDATAVQKFLDLNNISAYNTRIFKSNENPHHFTVRQAAAAKTETIMMKKDGEEKKVDGLDMPNDMKVDVMAGDYSTLMARVVENLEKAKEYSANQHQTDMLTHYIESFTSGDVKAHMDGSRAWVIDKGPAVESYIGFIESYRDPLGTRAEWEGFCAVVNREMSAKFNTLVEKAESLLPLLPWPKEFEKDTFLRPDFTSLDVISFASSGIPAGINIPNYDLIRQNEGFKNVSLGNVLAASMSQKAITFLSSENGDEEMYKSLVKDAFEVQVGLHELLGHGSGKLFYENEDGNFNFDKSVTINPLTNTTVEKYYKAGETWDSKFPGFGSSYEECRAECVGIFLCTNLDVLKIFGHEGEGAQNIMYINWLNMARAGFVALEFYRPETQSWGQAHMQARYCILQCLLEAGQDFVSITKDDSKGYIVSLDREKIFSVGLPAIHAFLNRIQVYKSTADFDAAKSMYIDGYSQVSEEFLAMRTIVLEKKKERALFVQPNMTIENDVVVLKEYETNFLGIISSFNERFPSFDGELLDLWFQDKEMCKPL